MNKTHLTSEYLWRWLPNLGSYQSFNQRINRPSNVMNTFVEMLLTECGPKGCSSKHIVLNSIPSITFSRKRLGKVACKITDKNSCSTKIMYYYAVKLHALRFCNLNRLLHLMQRMFTPTSINALALFKESWFELKNRIFLGDKVYNNTYFFKRINNSFNTEMLTPIKAINSSLIF